jgi:hypothetical protein
MALHPPSAPPPLSLFLAPVVSLISLDLSSSQTFEQGFNTLRANPKRLSRISRLVSWVQRTNNVSAKLFRTSPYGYFDISSQEDNQVNLHMNAHGEWSVSGTIVVMINCKSDKPERGQERDPYFYGDNLVSSFGMCSLTSSCVGGGDNTRMSVHSYCILVCVIIACIKLGQG